MLPEINGMRNSANIQLAELNMRISENGHRSEKSLDPFQQQPGRLSALNQGVNTQNILGTDANENRSQKSNRSRRSNQSSKG